MATKDRTPFQADDAITADILDLAPELIDRHGWWSSPGCATGPDRPLNALSAITRASLITIGEEPEVFDYIEAATRVLEATLAIDAGTLLEWNNAQAAAEAVTDALRFASLSLRYEA